MQGRHKQQKVKKMTPEQLAAIRRQQISTLAFEFLKSEVKHSGLQNITVDDVDETFKLADIFLSRFEHYSKQKQ